MSQACLSLGVNALGGSGAWLDCLLVAALRSEVPHPLAPEALDLTPVSLGWWCTWLVVHLLLPSLALRTNMLMAIGIGRRLHLQRTTQSAHEGMRT